jgi:hypothetical protein
MELQNIRAWSVAVLAALGAFLAAGVLGSIVAGWLGRWELPASGFAAALAVVLTAYMAVPSKRVISACLVFLIGAITAAWILYNRASYPESYERVAYQRTNLPLWLTLSGGVLGLSAVLAIDRLSKHASPNNTMEPTR